MQKSCVWDVQKKLKKEMSFFVKSVHEIFVKCAIFLSETFFWAIEEWLRHLLDTGMEYVEIGKGTGRLLSVRDSLILPLGRVKNYIQSVMWRKYLDIPTFPQGQDSNAMDPQSVFSVKLSAPGKVILFGEYSVVFKKPAIAATLSLRTKLHLCKTNSGTVELDFSAMNIRKSFPLKDLQECFKLSQTDNWDAYLESLLKSFECLCKRSETLSDLTEAQKLSLIAFFHCFGKWFDCSGFSLKIDSELPVGSGVGSSASFSVVLSAAGLLFDRYGFSRASGLIERKENGEVIMTEEFKKEISKVAYSCEKIFHGSPSGVDHNTILRGSMLEFTKLDDNNNKITPINTSSLKILLVNTNIPRSTKKNVANVKLLKETHPEVIGCVLNGMENIVKDAVRDLSEFSETGSETAKSEAHFAELISLNHNLLRVLGTSHPALELIVSTADKYGLRGKLTGGGGGGFGFIYIPKNLEFSVVKSIEKDLSAAGFTVYDVSLGGPGLTVDEIIF